MFSPFYFSGPANPSRQEAPDTKEKSAETSEKALADTPDGEEPTEEEKKTLRHVAENLPVSAWLVAVVELCERFTYYGMSGLFQNYINLPLDGSQGRGALGMGHRGATGLTTFFQFWCYGEYSPWGESEYANKQSLPFLAPSWPISTWANTRLSCCSPASTWSDC